MTISNLLPAVPFLLFLTSSIVAASVPDELKSAREPARILTALLLLITTAITLFPLISVWAQLTLLTILFLALLRYDPLVLYAILAAPLTLLSSPPVAEWSLAFILLATISAGTLFASRQVASRHEERKHRQEKRVAWSVLWRAARWLTLPYLLSALLIGTLSKL